jgi:hypothetical protein
MMSTMFAVTAIYVVIIYIVAKTITTKSRCTHDCEQGRKCTCEKKDTNDKDKDPT